LLGSSKLTILYSLEHFSLPSTEISTHTFHVILNFNPFWKRMISHWFWKLNTHVTNDSHFTSVCLSTYTDVANESLSMWHHIWHVMWVT
jgi:hypothetical protein